MSKLQTILLLLLLSCCHALGQTTSGGGGGSSAAIGGTGTGGGDVNIASSLFCNASQLSGGSDATACVQAAIDYAYNNGYQNIYCPGNSTLHTSGPIYLDPPGNLRSNLTNPTIFGFSLSFIGQGESGGNGGCRIYPSSNSFIAFWVGPGTGMKVGNIEIIGPTGSYRGEQSSSGAGIAVSGGNGGAVKTSMDGVDVENEYICYSFSPNNASLAETNTLIKATCENAFVGVLNLSGNSDVNSCYDCEFGATYGVATRKPWNIYGGNISAQGKYNTFGVSSTSSIAYSAPYYQFTTTVASPDTYMANGNVYSGFAMTTAHYGVVPLDLISYNSTTDVATFGVRQDWALGFNYYGNPTSNSTLATDLQAVTSVYAVERIWTLLGPVNVTGLWVENASSATTLLDETGTQSVCLNCDGPSHLSGIRFGYDIGLTGQTSEPYFYIQQTFPFIAVGGTVVEMDDSAGGEQTSASDRVLITQSLVGASFTYGRQGATNTSYVMFAPNLQVSLYGYGFTGNNYQNNFDAGGFGRFAESLWLDSMGATNATNAMRYQGWQAAPTWGYKPALDISPCLSPSQLTTLEGTLPTFTTGASISYPLVYGGTLYRICDWTGVPAHMFVASNHHFYSYGQNLTTTNVTAASWSYTAGSNVVYMSANLIARMFNGLEVQLNNGSSTYTYMVKGVYPSLGYVTVVNINLQTGTDGGYGFLEGTIGTAYSGTTVGQESYSFTTTQ
jgi:hypothetical protein